MADEGNENAAQAADRPPPVFAQCAIALNMPLTEESDRMAEVIDKNGGTVWSSLSDSGLELKDFSHIVSSTIDFPEYEQAIDLLIPVVKPEWITISLKKSKLQNTRHYSPDPKYFLSNVTLCCAELPQGDKEAIIGGLIAMGGTYTRQLTKLVTHIVALDMTSEICEKVTSKRMGIKIVLPHWFDDCFRLGRRIDERPYLLPDPEILRLAQKGPVRHAENKHIVGASTTDPDQLPSAASAPSKNRQGLSVFSNKMMKLSGDLAIAGNLREKLEDLIRQSGGSVTASVTKAHILICRYREGQDFKIAMRKGIDIGNLSWLYHLIMHNKWSSPLQKLLHFPVARAGIPGFDQFRISLSNYSGEARIYLENLIVAAGGEITKTLKPRPDNTHLITAHQHSEKVSAARDWGLEVVNHLWLEESYARWIIQPVSNPRFSHFPDRTNLEEVVGQTKIDRDAVERHFLLDDDSMDVDPEESEPEPLQRKQGPMKNAARTPGKSRRIDHAIHIHPTPQASKFKGVSILKTPAASRFVSNEKENYTPGTGSSRKAKDVATAKLHEYAPDIALFEKEQKRVGGVVYGGPKPKEDKKGHSRKRSLDDQSATDDTDGQRQAKKPRPPPEIRLLVSGYDRWHPSDPSVEQTEKAQLRDLGILVVKEPSKCTHLAVPQILRTHKFVTALAYAPVVISTNFIDKCLEDDELLDPTDFPLRDKVTENRLSISLARSLALAKKNANSLLKGHMIYCVDSIHAGFDVVKSIIEANGGKCITYRGRPGTEVPQRRGMEDDVEEPLYLISGLKKDQVKMWSKFRYLAAGVRMQPTIVNMDWLLEVAMAQEIRPHSRHELNEADVKDD